MSRAPRRRNILHRVKQTEQRSRGIGSVQARGWRDLDLINGWAGEPGLAPPGYHRTGGYVYLRGVMSGGGEDSNFAVLPEGHRPEYEMRIATIASGLEPARITVETDGTLHVRGNNVGTWVTLDGLVFRAYA